MNKYQTSIRFFKYTMSTYKITLADYNQVQSTISNLLSSTYGTKVKSYQLSGSNLLIGSAEWDQIYYDLDRSYIHHYGPNASFDPNSPVTSGTEVLFSETSTYVTALTDMVNNYYNVHPSQLTNFSPITFTTATSSVLLHAITYSWPTLADAQHFFNLGGKITATSDFGSTAIFNYINYNSGLEYLYTAVTGDNNGLQILAMQTQSGGAVVRVEMEIIPNPGLTTIGGGTVHCYVSNSLTGGIDAVSPVIQDYADTGHLAYLPFNRIQLLGNTEKTVSITLTNSTLFDMTVTNIVLNQDPISSLNFQLLSPLPITVPESSHVTFSVLLSNPTEVGDGTQINPTLGLTFAPSEYLSTFTIPFPVELDFGLYLLPTSANLGGISVTGLYLGSTIYTTRQYTFAVRGYGGVLQSITGASISSSGWPGITVGVSIPQSTGPEFSFGVIELDLNTTQIPNGSISETILITAIDVAGNTASLTVPINYVFSVTEYHLGDWISPHDSYNGVIGFSYDYINGQPTLTMGVGMGGVSRLQLGDVVYLNYPYNQFSQYSVPQLGTWQAPGYVSHRLAVTGPYNVNSTSFVQTFGVWYTDQTISNFDETYRVLVRNTLNYTWTLQTSGCTASVYVNGSLVNLSSPLTIFYLANIYSVRIVATKTADHPSIALVLQTTTPNVAGHIDNIWSTLEYARPEWAEVSRQSFYYDTSIGQSFSMPPRLFNSNILSYAQYFANNSVVTVTDITGNGDLSIVINSVNAEPNDSPTVLTVANMQLLFYYYSLLENQQTFSAGKNDTTFATISNARYNNIGGNGVSTPFFTGFTRYGDVTTTQQPTPGSGQQGSNNGSDWLSTTIIKTILNEIGDIILGSLGFETGMGLYYDLAYALGAPITAPVILWNDITAGIQIVADYFSGFTAAAEAAGIGFNSLNGIAATAYVNQQSVIELGKAWISSIGNASPEVIQANYEAYQAAIAAAQATSQAATAAYIEASASSNICINAGPAIQYYSAPVQQALANAAAAQAEKETAVKIVTDIIDANGNLVPVGTDISNIAAATRNLVAATPSGDAPAIIDAGSKLIGQAPPSTTGLADLAAGGNPVAAELLPVVTDTGATVGAGATGAVAAAQTTVATITGSASGLTAAQIAAIESGVDPAAVDLFVQGVTDQAVSGGLWSTVVSGGSSIIGSLPVICADCVVATELTNQGKWSLISLIRLNKWATDNLDNHFFGDRIHRGYHIIGPKIMIPMLKSKNRFISNYIKWTFENGTNMLQGRKYNKWSIPNSLMWMLAMLLVGFFVSKATYEHSWKSLYKRK